MTTIAKMYGQYPLKLDSKVCDWSADTVKAALVLNTYTPDQDNHVFWSSANTFEASGGGYTSGGVTLSTKTRSYDGSSKTTTLSAASPLTYSGLTLSGVRYLVYYHSTGTPSTSVLAAYVDFGADQNPSAQNIVVTIAAAGILTFTVS